MDGQSKTLLEMTLPERLDLLGTVADALEASADEAEEVGDIRYVENSLCIAQTIRGLSRTIGAEELAAAELLLQQGIVMVEAFANRTSPRTLLH